MNKETIPEFARSELSDLLDEPGGILYSSHQTLKPGGIYLIGFNPGGSGGKPLRRSIDAMLTFTGNAYLDERWENSRTIWPKGEAPFQKRVKWLCEALGQETDNVCASNLIFLQSTDSKGMNYELAHRCWPVHQAILGVVQPRFIVAIGNSSQSAFGYLRSLLGGTEASLHSGHGNWLLKSLETELNGKPLTVLGFPHFSWYSPENKPAAIEWVRKWASVFEADDTNK